MHSYDTLSEAIRDLRKRGYQEDFNLTQGGVHCPALELKLHPEEFEINETYRFEGMSSTDDSSVLYAIESNDGVKGMLVDAYGTYANSLTPEMAGKLKLRLQS